MRNRMIQKLAKAFKADGHEHVNNGFYGWQVDLWLAGVRDVALHDLTLVTFSNAEAEEIRRENDECK